MILYDPQEAHLSETELHSEGHASTELTEDNLTIVYATHKHFSDPDISVSVLVTKTSLANFTRVTMASNVISTIVEPVKADDKSYHHIMLLILLGVFTFISVSLSLAILVFCRKKNTVFMLQKCEQESDVELDDFPTEIENSDTETEEIKTVMRIKRSESYPGVAKSSSERKTENSFLIKETSRNNASALVPLLKKVDKVKGATVLIVDYDSSTNSIRKSCTFSTQQECLNLLGKSKSPINYEYKFGSISKHHESTFSDSKYVAVATDETPIQEINKASGDCAQLESIIIDPGPEPTDTKETLTQEEDTFDFTHGKLEIL